MCGYMGSYGAALFACEHMDELYAHFRRDYVDKGLEELRGDGSLSDSEDVQGKCSLLSALYSLAKENKCGYEVNLRDIPVRQFTIEICELFGLNPYELESKIEIKIQASGDEPETPAFVPIGIATKKLEKIYHRD